MEHDIGERFFQQTRYTRENLAAMRVSHESERPGLYKEYPGKPVINLPNPRPPDDLFSLAKTLQMRRSVRGYITKPLTINQLSYLLWATDGVSLTAGEFNLRTAPSAGALYPIETYILVNHVEGIAPGLYHYAIKAHGLKSLKEGNLGRDFTRAAMGQRTCAEAAIVFIWTAMFQRTLYRYHDRGYRYLYLDTGHIAENLALTATAMGLASCQIGAYYDGEIDRLLGLDGTNESVVYMSVAGYAN